MIKVIVFDFGNVICSFDNNLFLKRISKFTNKSIWDLEKLIYQSSDLPRKYETGLITSDEFYKKIVKSCNLDIKKDDFIRAYTDKFTPIKSTYDLIKRLKPNYKLGLLSNTSEWDFNYGIKPLIDNLFDGISLSFQVKAMKPDKEIFFDILNKLKVKPEETVYIDDIKEYADAAQKLGMHGIHYTGYKNLIKELRKLNVRI